MRKWGNGPELLLCVHGMLRTGRDFYGVGEGLMDRFTVIAPDMIGRGRSDWADNPEASYQFPIYLRDTMQLFEQLDFDACYYLGTSMGGAVGIMWAAMPNTPIRKLILNDVDPLIAVDSTNVLTDHVKSIPKTFNSYEEGWAYFQRHYVEFGPLTEQQWRTIVDDSLIHDNGCWRVRYDPKITDVAQYLSEDVDLTPYFDQFDGEVRFIHGATSSILTQKRLDLLCKKSNVSVFEVPDAGHAPALLRQPEIQSIRDFLCCRMKR